jgi:hypothetical protein
MCRSPFSELPDEYKVEEFDAAVAARPVGELWRVEDDLAEIVGVSPWRWKDFTNLRKKPHRLFIDVDCILTTDVDQTLRKFVEFVRIKRQKILCFKRLVTPAPDYESIVLPPPTPNDVTHHQEASSDPANPTDWDGENDWSSWWELPTPAANPTDRGVLANLWDWFSSYLVRSGRHEETHRNRLDCDVRPLP